MDEPELCQKTSPELKRQMLTAQARSSSERGLSTNGSQAFYVLDVKAIPALQKYRANWFPITNGDGPRRLPRTYGAAFAPVNSNRRFAAHG